MKADGGASAASSPNATIANFAHDQRGPLPVMTRYNIGDDECSDIWTLVVTWTVYLLLFSIIPVCKAQVLDDIVTPGESGITLCLLSQFAKFPKPHNRNRARDRWNYAGFQWFGTWPRSLNSSKIINNVPLYCLSVWMAMSLSRKSLYKRTSFHITFASKIED